MGSKEAGMSRRVARLEVKITDLLEALEDILQIRLRGEVREIARIAEAAIKKATP